MQQVTASESGTAHGAFRGASYTVAGKTGTAQVSGIAQGEEYHAERLAERHRDHSLFIGYAPVDDPEIAIVVLVENSTLKSANVARAVLDTFFVSPDK